MLLEKLALSKGENEIFAVAHFISSYFFDTCGLFSGCLSGNIMSKPISTADLCDAFMRRAQTDFALLPSVCRHFGGREFFSGPIRLMHPALGQGRQK